MPGAKIKGKVVEVADDGSLITDITAEQLADAPHDERATVVCDEHETIGIHPANHSEPPMTFLAILGEDGRLRLTIVGDSAKIMLGIRVGEAVSVRW